MSVNNYFADLHIHTGMVESGKWIKIPTSRHLTVRNICEHALHQKGMDIIGLVDTLSPLVQTDISKLIGEGLLIPLGGGGYRYKERLTVLLGAEIETVEYQGGMAHTLMFLPDLEIMEKFSRYMEKFIKNINMSTQNAHMSLSSLVDAGISYEALIIPAHIFTPYKSIYGAAANRLSDLLTDKQLGKLSAVELGLSADTGMADRISELGAYSFITNSDAHSLEKIAREYTLFQIGSPDFYEISQALLRRNGNHVTANFGLDPRLGKYHRSLCEACGHVEQLHDKTSCDHCPQCGSAKLVRGVLDRINQIADYSTPNHPSWRPSYIYQIPLEFIPGIGKKTLQHLLAAFGTEMHILHSAGENELEAVVGAKLTRLILAARSGNAVIKVGGGGLYGKME